MRVSRFIKPYVREGEKLKSNIRFALNQSGVYIITRFGQIVYIGYSGSNLYKTAHRHFQAWKDKTQARVTYNINPKTDLEEFKIRIILCSPGRAAKLEKALIVKHQPIDNPDKLVLYEPTKWDYRALNDYEAQPVTNLEYLNYDPF